MAWRPLLILLWALPSFAATGEEREPAACARAGADACRWRSGRVRVCGGLGNEGTVCDGGPRPAGDALRLMFSREDEGLLVVIAITGLERGATGGGLPANLTVVRHGSGEFYGTLGADACLVEVEDNVPAGSDAWRVSGHGRCDGSHRGDRARGRDPRRGRSASAASPGGPTEDDGEAEVKRYMLPGAVHRAHARLALHTLTIASGVPEHLAVESLEI
jgi:hypothetical protein